MSLKFIPSRSRTRTSTLVLSLPRSALLLAELAMFAFLPACTLIRGSSQGAGRAGCWCAWLGPRQRPCCGLSPGASRIGPCMHLSLSALGSARTAAVPTGGDRQKCLLLMWKQILKSDILTSLSAELHVNSSRKQERAI